MQRALRLVRSRATEWGIATNRIGVMGFSAGGEVAFLASQRFNTGSPLSPNRSAPVSGAATLDGQSSVEISKAPAGSPQAAPEDGRTPEAARRDSGDTINHQSARPDFQALIYPGRTQRIEPATNSPPVFLVCGYNDRPFPLRLDRGEGQGEVSNLPRSEGLARVYLKFKQLKVPAELHIYAGSGHGFGLRLPSTINSPQSTNIGKWIERFEEWLAGCGF